LRTKSKLHLVNLTEQYEDLGGRQDVGNVMGLVYLRCTIAIGNEAIWVSPPQEQTEFPQQPELTRNIDWTAPLECCEPLVDGQLEVDSFAPLKVPSYETVKVSQQGLSALVANSQRALESQELLEVFGEGTSKTLVHEGTGNAQLLSRSMLIPAYFEIDRVSE
jgi:hypothetical protein